MAAPDHPLLPQVHRQLREGLMSRREFVRFATLLGMTASSAYSWAGLAAPRLAADNLPFPAVEPRAKKGGILRIGHPVGRMYDPATYNWSETANHTRPMLEYLSLLGPDNVVRPMLLEGWTPSADLTTWTLHVRPGVMWHNGEELIAEQVAWNIRRWSDPTLGSSNLGLSTFAALTELSGERDSKGLPVRRRLKDGIEVRDRHTLVLHLSQPVLSVPEDCAEYCTLVVHPSFTPPLSSHPIGTGPFTLKELRVGERCILKRVTKTTDGAEFRYWGGDVYLDEIRFYHFEQENQTAALASGTVDAIYELVLGQLELAQSIPGAQILSVDAAQTLCCRMQVDAKPFDDVRVRRAIVLAADNAALRKLTFGDHGSVADNSHVSPIHPEYFPLPPALRDVAGARRLLREAGHERGLDVTISVGNNDGPWQQAACEALRDQLKEADIRLAVDVIPPTKFLEVWNKVPFGATSWSHRPLGTMALAQAYRTGASWNETHFSDPAFDKALSEAEATIDVAARRLKMQKVQQLLRDAALMVQPFWRPVFGLASDRVHGYLPHPARQVQLNKVWLG